MNKKFVENVTSLWGKEGQEWLNNIPQIIAEFEKRWEITVGEPFELSYNYVARATQKDGTPVVIKIGFPKDQEFLSELETLPLFNDRGMVRQLRQNAEQAVMLLERIEPGIAVSKIDDEKATEAIAKVMKKFWVKAPVKSDHIVKVHRWTKGFQKLRDSFKGKTGPLPKVLVDQAEEIYAKLSTAKEPQFLLHGDLHHENVLSATREPWLAIDPKGIIGPRERETAPMLMNPEGFILKNSDPKEVLRKRILILSKVLELEPRRILEWGIAQTMLSVIWTLEDHSKVNEERLTIAEILSSLQ